MRVAIGCDHRGLALKEEVGRLLQEMGIEYKDFGCFSGDTVDYPDVAQRVAGAVAQSEFQQGILICATGIGMSIAANKVPGVRAALCNDTFSARRAREHNDANLLCLGGMVTGPGLAREIVLSYLSSSFEGGRHGPRIEKISALDRERHRV